MFWTTHSVPRANFVTSSLATFQAKNLRRISALTLIIFLAAVTALAQKPAGEGPIVANEWTWMGGSDTISAPGVYGLLGTPAPTDIPASRGGHPVSWTDNSGNFWIFSGCCTWTNDLWEFSPTTNEWTWVGGSSTGNDPGVYGSLYTPAATNIPGGRFFSVSTSDSSGHLWLYGGDGLDVSGTAGYLNDLWEYYPATNEWAWMSGSNTVNHPGIYGSPGSPAPGNTPGARYGAALWTDNSNNLWVFGGAGYDVNGTFGDLNDLWVFNTTSHEWAWMGGSNTANHTGVYGTLGSPASTNTPGGKFGPASWTDSSGHFWLMGGDGYDVNGNGGFLNDLWEFNPATVQWTWIGGGKTYNPAGVYGTPGTPAATNIPGGRYFPSTWIDKSGNLWLFGSYGYDASDTQGWMNDLWEYIPTTNQWAWMSGSKTVPSPGTGQPGIYGTLGIQAATNTPGGRGGENNWVDSEGNLWLFDGGAYDINGNFGNINDLWKFQLAIPTNTSLTSSLNPSTYGTSVTFSASVVPTTGSSTPTGSIQFSINGSPVGSPATLVNGDASYTTSTLAAGTYTVTAAYTPLDAYTASTSNTVTQIVDQAAQTISFAAIGNQYLGVAPITLNATDSSGLAVTYTVSGGPATISGNILTLTGVGTVTVLANQSGNTNYLVAPTASQSITVIQPTLTWNPPVSIIYGSKFGSVMTASAPVPGTYVYYAAGNIVTNSTVLNVAVYQLTVLFNPTYAGRQLKAGPRFTVAPATLTVTPHNLSVQYSSQVPVFAYNLTGFVNGDNSSVVSGVPTFITTATQRATQTRGVVLFTSPVGTYTINTTWGSLKAANYTFAFTTSTLLITQSSQFLTVTARNQSITYGSPIPTLTYTLTGFLGWDTQATQTVRAPGITTTAVQGSPKGTYTLTASIGRLTQIYNNYAGFKFVNGTLTIH